jgi:hypothetical protein
MRITDLEVIFVCPIIERSAGREHSFDACILLMFNLQVNKLKQLGLLGDDLLHTVNGKEYITVKQLRMEMRSKVHKQGRISLVDLATTLGVDLFHIERQVQLKNLCVNSFTELVLVFENEVTTNAIRNSCSLNVRFSIRKAGELIATRSI